MLHNWKDEAGIATATDAIMKVCFPVKKNPIFNFFSLHQAAGTAFMLFPFTPEVLNPHLSPLQMEIIILFLFFFYVIESM